MKQLTITFLLFLITISFVSGQGYSYYSDGYKMEHYKAKDGIPVIEIGDIIKDKKGNIWLSNLESIIKYNGYEFKSYTPNPDSLIQGSSNVLWKLCEDNNGNIWVGSKGGGLLKFNPILETFERYGIIDNDTLLGRFITHFHVENDSAMLIGSLGNAFQLDIVNNKAESKKSGPYQRLGRSVSQIFQGEEDDLWIAGSLTLERVISLEQSINDETNIKDYGKLIQTDTSKEWGVNWMTPRKEGGFWVLLREEVEKDIATSSIGILNPKEETFRRIKFHRPEFPLDMKFRPLTRAIEDNNGTLWVASWGEGLHKINPPFVFENEEGISEIVSVDLIKNDFVDFIRDFQIDDNGNLWIGSRQLFY